MRGRSVLVADGHLLFAQALARALRPDEGLTVIPEHPISGLELATLMERRRPTVAVVDWWLRDTNALAVARMVAAVSPETALVLLSWFRPKPRDVAEAKELGAAVLSKNVSLAGLQSVLTVAPPAAGRPSAVAPAEVKADSHRPDAVREAMWAKLATLTPREVDVLRALTVGRPNKEFARSLGITVGTVRNHIHQILTKLEATTTTEAALLAESAGLFFDAPPATSPAGRSPGGPLGGSGAEAPAPSDTSRPVRVLVADAQPLFAEALGVALEREGFIWVGGVVSDGPSMLSAALAGHPDVALVDQSLPRSGGAEATRSLLSWSSGCRVVVLAFGAISTRQVVEALEAGAAGFCPKTLPLQQIFEAVRQARAGADLVFGEQLIAMVAGIDERDESGKTSFERMSTLTSRELEVMAALAVESDRGQVAEQLGISPGTLKNYVRSILDKTGARTVREVVTMARLMRHPAVCAGGWDGL